MVKKRHISIGRVVKNLLSLKKMSKGDLAAECGITRQALSKRLNSAVSLDAFVQMVEATGHIVLIADVINGEAKNIRKLTKYEEEWI